MSSLGASGFNLSTISSSNITNFNDDVEAIIQQSITSSLTYYVSTTGSDSNDGSAANPFATVQKAVDSLKGYTIKSTVTISIGSGSFDKFRVEGLNFDGLGELIIQGSYDVEYTGTVSSSVTNTPPKYTITDNLASFTNDQYKGYFFARPTVDIATYGYDAKFTPIVTNTNNTISMPYYISAGVTQYQIINLTTLIDGASSTEPSVFIGKCSSGLFKTTPTTPDTYRIKLINLSIYNSDAVQGIGLVSTDATFSAICCKMSALKGLPTVTTTSTFIFSGCYIASNITGTGVNTNLGNNQANIFTGVRNCYLRKISNTTSGTWISPSGALYLSSTAIEGGSIGVLLSVSVFNAVLMSLWTINTTTPISATGLTFSYLLICTGATTGILLNGGAVALTTSFTSSIQSATGANVLAGSRLQINSTSTITSTVADLSVDGTTSTLAAMRANTPKIFPLTPNAYGSYVYQ